MSTQRTSHACKINPSYCKFGAETLLKILDGTDEQIDGVIKNIDVECVHKTRVSSRRIRAALPLFSFCFSKKEFKAWTKEIKKVTRLLANARDLDVQIAFIQQYMKNLDSTEKANLNVLLKNHKNCRKNIQSSVTSGLEELKSTDTLGAIREYCEQTIANLSNQTFDSSQVLEKAHWHISFRLDDFLSLQQYVYLEDEKLKHHQMRIYAKKLRYTMECFASQYPSKLDSEIETVKAFQDVLGEMHDCDVWIDYIPQFAENLKTKSNSKNKIGRNSEANIDQALQNFLIYIKDRRKKFYSQFVDLWDESKKSGFFDQLRKTTNLEFTTATQEKMKQAFANPHVKVAVLSDVHANVQALERVFEDAEERGVDVFLNAGDSIGFGANPDEVVELLCEKNVLSIVGNYDVEVMQGKSDAKGEKRLAYKFTKKELAEACECYLQSLPHELRLLVAGKKLLMVHGSPESINEHLYANTSVQRLKVLADNAQADVIVMGHSHEQFCREENGVCFLNPGSVGRPGDGNPQASYAIIRFDPFNVELIKLDYDVEAAADALRRRGLPESFAQMLLQGVSLDVVTAEDQTKEATVDDNCKEKVKACDEFSKSRWPDVEHYLQVTNLALGLFDGLTDLHKLSNLERCWLECAAILHDIGLSKNGSAHHKKSAELILNDTQLPFTSRERRIIASIARYHRKGLPKQNQYLLAPLDRVTLHKVNVLASLLRIADSLDYTHESSVKLLGVKVGAKKVTAECISKTDLTLEQQAFNKKKDLFEKVFKRKMVLTWKQPLKK